MKDYTRAEFEAAMASGVDAKKYVDFCLEQIFADNDHRISDHLVRDLTFEELIGALISAQRALKDADEREEEWERLAAGWPKE